MHDKLIAHWSPPAAPKKYPDLTVVRPGLELGQEWHLDFSRRDSDSPVGRFFASDAAQCPGIQWPWVAGFAPQPADWQAIGFVVVEFPTDAGAIEKASKAAISAFMRGAGVTLH